MTHLRTHLAGLLARRVDSRGLVVWSDPAQEYLDVAATVVPPSTRFEPYRGSWYALRRRIDPDIAGDTPPRLVVYVPAPPPTEDPLTEVRAMASDFKIRLATLVRQALAGELTQQRIETIARTARTLSAAELALSGDTGADVRLISALGTPDTTAMLVAVLSGHRDAALADPEVSGLVDDMCRRVVGATTTAENRPERLFAQLLLNDLALALGAPPDGPLATATPHATTEQRRPSRVALQHLRLTPAGTARYRQLAAAADESLHLTGSLTWDDRLADVAGTPALEQLACAAAVRRLAAGDAAGARMLTLARQATGLWATDPVGPWRPRWRLIHSLLDLQHAIADNPPAGGTAGDQLAWYAESGWTVDRAHRRMELARTELAALEDLDPLVTAARDAYDTWLDSVLTSFTTSVESGGLDTGTLLRAGQIHDTYLTDAPHSAYVWVDALRLDLGHDLRESLSSLAADIDLRPAVTVAPTITPIGMAALLPAAADSLAVTRSGDIITATIAGQPVITVGDRGNHLRARHGTVVDLDLNQAANRAERQLQRDVSHADLVLIRSQELDAAGETGMLAVAWSGFDTVTTVLRTVITRLAAAGVRRVVVTADHGFIALSQGLGPQRLVDPPAGADGTLKRRCFVGVGGVPNLATVRVPLSACGVTSAAEITVPRGLAVFRAGGARQFFHGGLSPQELLVPVLVLNLDNAPTAEQARVTITVAGDRITTGVFAATVTFEATLFTDSVVVRAVAARGGRPVARLVSGDGVTDGTDVVKVAADRPSVLTFQVTDNLEPADPVELRVLDAGTGRTLTTATVAVAAPILVEDDLV